MITMNALKLTDTLNRTYKLNRTSFSSWTYIIIWKCTENDDTIFSRAAAVNLNKMYGTGRAPGRAHTFATQYS